jgi:hypothetical protein
MIKHSVEGTISKAVITAYDEKNFGFYFELEGEADGLKYVMTRNQSKQMSKEKAEIFAKSFPIGSKIFADVEYNFEQYPHAIVHTIHSIMPITSQ